MSDDTGVPTVSGPSRGHQWTRIVSAMIAITAFSLGSTACGGDDSGENSFRFGATANSENHTFTFNGYKINADYLSEEDVVIEFGNVSRIILDMTEVSRWACDSDVWVKNDEDVIEVVAEATWGELAEIGVSAPGFVSVDDCDFGVVRSE